jgi:hypothetical protein
MIDEREPGLLPFTAPRYGRKLAAHSNVAARVLSRVRG